MLHRNRCGKVNVKLVVILILVTAAVGVSLVVARQTRRSVLSEKAFAAGEAAFGNKDWPAAAKSYREYLGRNPNDIGILRKYAEACLSVRPLDAAVVSGAISAYRRIIELVPGDDVAYQKLAMLYGGVGNFEELGSVARARLAREPNDLKAPLWLAEALARSNKTAEARQMLTTFMARLQPLPDRHVEYVRACVQMSQLAASEPSPKPRATAGDANSPPPPTPLDWLNKAVDYSPDSAEVLVSRAQFQRRMAEMPATSAQDKSTFLALARKDLEAADAKGTEDPRVRFLLGAEWMAHGELDRAAAELGAIEKLPPEKLKEHFFDLSDWTVARFLFASELAARKGAAGEAASLADETLKMLTEKRHRAQVLSSAIPLYAAAGRVAEARRCLDEYLGLVRAQEGAAESPRRLAGLQALVAGAENRPYAVIEALEPIVANDSSNPGLWRMLAEAYDRTGQAGRAVKALVQYRRLNPQDEQAMRELARQYCKLGDWQKAYDTATAAESLGSTDLVLKLLRIGAGINLAAGQRDSARTGGLKKLSAELAILRRAQPDQVDIRVLQAVIAEGLGRTEEAESELKRAVEECKEPLHAEMQLTRHYARTKRMKEAVSVCEAACKRHGTLAEPWLFLSDLHVANADYDSARNCLRQGLSTVTEKQDKRSLSVRLALLELIHGDRATGIGLLKELVSQDPQEIQARSLLLSIREIQGDRALAEKLVAELRQAEGDGGLWWRLHQASLWLSSKDWSARQKDITNSLRYCIDADPAWSAPVLLLAGMYERLGDFKEVEDVCRQGLLGDPSAADIADRLLALLERQGRFADAEKVLRQIEISPRLASAWQVRVALGAKDFSRAIDELKVRASNDDQDATSRIQLARLVYQETKDAGQAFEYLKQAEAIAADSRPLAAVRASILRGEGKAAEALQVLDAYVAKHDEFDAYWMRAMYLAEEGKVDRAEEDYKKLTTFAQNGAVGYDLLGNFYAGTGRLDQAVAAVEEGLSAYPEDLRLKRRLMQMLFQRAQAQDREKAVEILATLEERLPQDTELMTLRALQMLQEETPQSLAGARERLEIVVKREPKAVNAHLALIAAAMRQREYKIACDYAVRSLESNPGNPALLLARARAELALGYVPMAVRLAREALRQDPNNSDALSVIVGASLVGNDRSLLEEARTLIESALRRNPADERLLIGWSRVLAGLGLPKTAIPQLEAHCQTKEGSGSVTALLTLADLYRRAGDAERARQWIGHAAALAPTSLDARLGLASGLYQTGDAEGAQKIYRQLLEQYPEDTRVLNDLAWTLQEHDQRYAEALELADKGLRLAPGDPHLLDTRGTILLNVPDRLTDAKSDFEELARLSSSDPSRAKALLQLGRTCAKLNDFTQARQYLENAMEIDRKIQVFTPDERSEISRIIEMKGGS
jgi:tetratricopeptide (TPR) repeat protein